MFQGLLYPLYGSLRHGITSTSKAGSQQRLKKEVKVNHWVATTCTETEQWLTVLRILLLSTHMQFLLLDLVARGCIVHQWQLSSNMLNVVLLSVSAVAHSSSQGVCVTSVSFCHTSVIQTIQLSKRPLGPMCSDNWFPTVLPNYTKLQGKFGYISCQLTTGMYYWPLEYGGILRMSLVVLRYASVCMASYFCICIHLTLLLWITRF